MITYVYKCSECEAEIEAEQSIKDAPYKDCVFCETEGVLFRVIQPVDFFLQKDPSTVGQLAERNSKKLGRYGLESAQQEQKDKYNKEKERQRQELQEKLPSGMKLREPPKKDYKSPWGELPKEKKKILSDKNKVQKYILEGK